MEALAYEVGELYLNMLPATAIPIEDFEILTGKRINWKVRRGKYIHVLRDRGHIRLYDDAFIPGEKYKNKTGTYMCHHVDKKGNALLNKVGKNMVVKSAKKPYEIWEIV